ncbi:MAG TPA: hypothetical protein VGC47_08745 [Acidimicrobiia bacterium]|jgi:uncharacterized membrane protein
MTPRSPYQDAGDRRSPNQDAGDRPTPPEPITRLSEVRSDHNVVAAVDGSESARTMILHLERLGIDSDHISLLGAQPVQEAADNPLTGVTRPFAARTAIGAIVGGAVGAAIGVVAGLMFPFLGSALTAALLAPAGAMAGAVTAAIASMAGSDAWNDSFAIDEKANVVVGVHTRDVAEADHAYELMVELEPLAVNRF